MHISIPSIENFQEAAGEFLDTILRVTLAPEKDIGLQLTDYLISKGIIVSFGHTSCDAETAHAFFDKTDSIATHMFNAMPSIHHRTPAITTVALNRENVFCEIIPDLMHVHPEVIRLLFKIKGAGKTIAVSDSIMAAGLPEGDYEFSGLKVTVDKRSARLKEGNLAGSIITMAEGVKNLINCGIATEFALASATSSPAAAMGMSGEIGYIKEGQQADIIVLDGEYAVEAVIKNGIRLRS